ncbi:hypothetical protein EAG_07974 [Camponotus floridanus]|uniref:Uncharacterized protein n=1 Tax=Camponotus floridanus TaxID=104421 RepID=E2ACW9_CAMFO|nr:hypothetical protein EAG_07974 [Camponotus floridanus]
MLYRDIGFIVPILLRRDKRRVFSAIPSLKNMENMVLYSGDNGVVGADRIAAFTVHSPKMRDALGIVMRTPLVFLSADSSSRKTNEKEDSTLSSRNFSALTNSYTAHASACENDPENLDNERYIFEFDDSIVKYSRRQASGSVTRSARRNRVQASRRIMQNDAGLPATAPTHARDRSIYRTERPPGG